MQGQSHVTPLLQSRLTRAKGLEHKLKYLPAEHFTVRAFGQSRSYRQSYGAVDSFAPLAGTFAPRGLVRAACILSEGSGASQGRRPPIHSHVRTVSPKVG